MAKIAERKMMTKEKSYSVAGKKRSRRGRRVIAWFLAIAMILTTISLPGNGKQARAMDISKQSEDEKLDIVMEGEVPVLKKITYSFKGDIGPSEGNWYLYVWEKGDTSGTDGTPAIVKGEALETSDEFYKVETDLDGEEGAVYVFGICFKDSRWSDDPSPEGWPSLSDACDYRIISDRSVADNLTVTVDGKKVSVSAEEVMADPMEYVCYHEWEVTKTTEPDCVKDGSIEKTCSKCGTVRTLPGDTALGHNYVDGSCTRCRVEDPTPIKPSGEGTKESPYQITKVGELYWFAGLVNGDSAVCDYKADSNPEGVKQNLSACAELVNDITVNKGVLDEEGNPVAGQFTEWIPIGGESNKYAGTFNGNEKAIRGLYINNAEKEYVGLFGYNDTTARIENLSVTDSYFYAQWYVGGVCARNEGGTIQNCHNSSRISGGGYYNLLTAGGICAFNNGTITKCSNSGTIYGNVKVCWLGGICCGNRINGIVENCVNTGTIEVGNFCEDGYIGGVAGYNFEKIKGCHNEGTIEGGKNVFSSGLNVGGVSGGNKGSQSQIIRCYNTGSVSGNWSVYTGGVCGYCEYYSEGTGIVQLCYNDGEVSGSGAGGVCGFNDRARVLNCYNLKQMTDSDTKGICSEVSSNGGTVENCFSIGGKGIGTDHTTEKTAFINSYYLSDTETEDGGKTLTQFQNGEVAWLLQEGQTADEETGEIPQVWGQNIDNDGERQYYPALNGDTAKVYETSAESDCQGYSNTKDKVREHYFGENCTDEICDYCCEIKNINYPGLSAECSDITYDGKSHTPEITIKAKKADNSDTASSDVDNVSDAGNSGADSSGGSGSSGDSGADNSGNSGADNAGNSDADNSGDLPEDAGSLTEGTDYEVSVTPQTEVSADANGYTAIITGKGAYAGTRTVQWNLKPIELKLTVAGEATKPYDGTTDVFLDDILTNITTSLDGVLEEDKNDVSAKVSYAFADANANDSVVVNVTKAILEGNKSINYTLAEDITNTITGRITKSANAPSLPQQQERKVAYTVDTVEKVTLPVGWEWAEEDKTKTLTVGETVTATAVYAGADKGNYETESVEIAITRQACTHEGTWDDGRVTKQPTEKETGVKTYTCTVCGETRTEEIPVVKPSGGNGTSDNNGTSDGNGTSNGNSNSGDVSRLPVKGSVITDDQKTGQYQILNPAAKEVTFKGMANKNAKSVTIPATVKIKGVTCKVTGIADNAMKGSKKLTKAVIGSNVKTIGKNAFAGSKKLKTVKIGKNVTSIGANAFKKCTAVTSLTLPAKTVKIGANAFNGCKKLKKLNIKSKKMTKKTVAKNAFKGLTRKTKIKAPKAKVKTYKKLFRKRGLSGKVKVTK